MRNTLIVLTALLLMTACSASSIAPSTATPAPASTEMSEPAATQTQPPTEAPAPALSTDTPAPALATDTPTLAPTDTPAATVTAAPPATEPASALTAEQRELLASLDTLGPAPELTNEVWLNSEPLQLADLRGQVVMVEFWTYG